MMSVLIDQFHLMDIDQRILKAIADLCWQKATDIQQAAIPLILENKNVVVKARTGSGKTAAYVIPLIHQILTDKEFQVNQNTTILVITPTKELCNQAFKNIKELTKYCSKQVSFLDVAAHQNPDILKPLLAERPDIVIGTPSRLLAQVRSQNLVLDHLKTLVIDEADLVFGFGHEQETRALRQLIKAESFQAILMSATLGSEVKSLRKALHKKATWCRVELPEDNFLPSSSQLIQYIIRAQQKTKFIILCALFKLRLIRGKTLIFVNSVDKCFKLKLFLEDFGIRSVILNAELPVASRCHSVDQFNQGLYDIILASDDASIMDSEKSDKKSSNRPGKSRTNDKEFGVSRGIDFHLVSNVINFDFPQSALAYVHRVGRTARADQKGTALSLVSEREMSLVAEVEKLLGKSQEGEDSVFRPFQFKMEEIDGFKYRAEDSLSKITTLKIREARKREIKEELVKSERLKSYFEDNQTDFKLLRHDKPLLSNAQEHLKHIPDYLVPESLQTLMTSRRKKNKSKGNRDKKNFLRSQNMKKVAKKKRSSGNPLFSFRSGTKKKS